MVRPRYLGLVMPDFSIDRVRRDRGGPRTAGERPVRDPVVLRAVIDELLAALFARLQRRGHALRRVDCVLYQESRPPAIPAGGRPRSGAGGDGLVAWTGRSPGLFPRDRRRRRPVLDLPRVRRGPLVSPRRVCIVAPLPHPPCKSAIFRVRCHPGHRGGSHALPASALGVPLPRCVGWSGRFRTDNRIDRREDPTARHAAGRRRRSDRIGHRLSIVPRRYVERRA